MRWAGSFLFADVVCMCRRRGKGEVPCYFGFCCCCFSQCASCVHLFLSFFLVVEEKRQKILHYCRNEETLLVILFACVSLM